MANATGIILIGIFLNFEMVRMPFVAFQLQVLKIFF